MPTENLSETLLNVVTTTKIRDELFRELREVHTELLKKPHFTLQNTQTKYPIVVEILQKQGLEMSTGLDQQFVENVESFLKSLKEVVVHVPKHLSENSGENQEAFEKELALWKKDNIPAQSVVKVKADGKVTAGLMCSYGGQYRDFTLDKVIEDAIYG